MRQVLGPGALGRPKCFLNVGCFGVSLILPEGFPGGSVVKKPSANAGDVSSIFGLGRSRGGGIGYPFLYSCLGNPIDRGA